MAAPIVMESCKFLGASSVSINYHELYTTMQLGTAEGEESPLWSIWEMKFKKYVILSNHVAFISTMIANKKWFEGLPANIQGNLITKATKATVPVALESDGKIKKDPGTTIIELTRKVYRPSKID